MHATPIFKTVRAMDGAAGASMDGFTAFLKTLLMWRTAIG